jgi:hypothetical protein
MLVGDAQQGLGVEVQLHLGPIRVRRPPPTLGVRAYTTSRSLRCSDGASRGEASVVPVRPTTTRDDGHHPMLELTDWFSSATFPARPWLVIGKGPTFDRRDRFDLGEYNTVGLNHVVQQVTVDVAHVIDIGVVADCAESLRARCTWLVMPRWPHEASRPGSRMLEEWFDDVPVLRELDERGRLVWYNGITGRPEAGSPVIDTGEFSSEAVLRILGRMGARTVRTLGIDGGRAYANAFEHLAAATLLENGAPAFDVQFERMLAIAAQFDLDVSPLVEPLRVFIGADESQVVAHRVLEYSIRKHASIPVEVVPMLDLEHPMPRDPRNQPRTAFSFRRFMIPALCEYRGRALYLDADMLVFGDVAELADLPFGDAPVLCTPGDPTDAWRGHETVEHFGAGLAVMLLDCDRLRWKVEDVVSALDAGHYTYEELMSNAAVIDGSGIEESIPPEWNDLEHYDPSSTRLVHFTVVPTQPWKNDDHALGDLWGSVYREAVAAGAVPPEEVEALVSAGHVKESLRDTLRLAPTRRSVVTNASLDLIDAQRRIASLESRIEAMEHSSSWRIGQAVTKAARTPIDAVKRARARAR